MHGCKEALLVIALGNDVYKDVVLFPQAVHQVGLREVVGALAVKLATVSHKLLLREIHLGFFG